MPFISEELWEKVTGKKGLIIEKWPQVNEQFINDDLENKMEKIFNIIKIIRNLRSSANYPPQKKAKVILKPLVENYQLPISNSQIQAYLKHLANVEELQITNYVEQDNREKSEKNLKFKIQNSKLENELAESLTLKLTNALSQRTEEFEIYLLLDELEVKKEIEKLQKEKEKILIQLEIINKKFTNKDFLKKAKKEVIEKETQKREQFQLKLDSINRRLTSLQS